MRKIEYNKKDAITFMKEVIASKKKKQNDLTYKNRCQRLLDEKTDAVKTYDVAFNNNNLEMLLPSTSLSEKECDDLQSLYNYGSIPFLRLRESIIIDRNQRRNDDCPLCGLNKVNTLDHFLPKEDFSEFCIHPRNLIPCCSRCNSHKSKCWHKEGKREIWNAYLNELPEEQYLFCRITMQKGIPFASYYIQQGKLDNESYRLIKNTFDKLHIIEYYNNASDRVIESFIHQVIKQCSLFIRYNIDENIELLKKEIENPDVNDRVFVLQKAFLNSSDAIEYIKTCL